MEGEGYADHVYAVTVDVGNRKPCEFCPGTIISGTTNKGRHAWFDAETDETGRHPNHWVTCKGAGQARAAFRR